MLQLYQPVTTMLGRRAWPTTAGNPIVEDFFTHLHLHEYEFAMDRLLMTQSGRMAVSSTAKKSK